MRLPKRLAVLAVMAISGLFLGAHAGSAAPQVLTLIATDGPIAFRCDGERCVTELASLCLQPWRRAPEAGRIYHAMRNDDLVLVGTAADGTARARPLPPEARLVALRTHVAVALIVPQAWIERHFAALDGVTVDNLSPLVPAAAPDDTAPLTEAELRSAKSELTAVARGVFAGAHEQVSAVRVAARMINALPVSGQVDDQTLAAAWRDAGGPLARSEAGGAAPSLARVNYDFCRFSRQSGLSPSARACLQAQQDGALEYLHGRYLEALNAGS